MAAPVRTSAIALTKDSGRTTILIVCPCARAACEGNARLATDSQSAKYFASDKNSFYRIKRRKFSRTIFARQPERTLPNCRALRRRRVCSLFKSDCWRSFCTRVFLPFTYISSIYHVDAPAYPLTTSSEPFVTSLHPCTMPQLLCPGGPAVGMTFSTSHILLVLLDLPCHWSAEWWVKR